ncbi:MAG: phytoene desaturase family protein [Gammaproteobacteria bacterium]|nr:phytoene desaturase family protein [Gammaproteobacteria bacterium]
MPEAIVVGGGFGGIASALRLRARGYDVAIYDRCERLGGRAQVFEQDGFRHDAGPTVITAPFLFDELFALFEKKREDFVDFVPLSPWYRFWFSDGKTFDYGGTIEDTLAQIGQFNAADVNGYKNLLHQSKQIFEVGFNQLSDQPFHSVMTMIKQVPNLLRLNCQQTVWDLVSSHLQDPHLRQAFSIQPLLVGGNPFDTTSIYGLIHYLEREWGIHFAMGGTGAIVDALEQLMRSQGIDIHLNQSVSRLLVENDRVSGIQLDSGEKIETHTVVSNVDPAYLYRHMLDKKYQRGLVGLKQKHSQFSMGLFVLYFGTTRQYPEVAHHTIWMGQRYRELLRDIFHGDALPEDFSLYLHRPTATDPSFAPPGCDSFYVLAPVPNLKASIDWSMEGPLLKQRIVNALSETLLPGLDNCITADFFMTPQDFANDYLSEHGAGFSVAPLFRQSAWFRFHNRAEGPENLFLVGAGTHPGAGVPGVLSSAKVLENLLPSSRSLQEAAA